MIKWFVWGESFVIMLMIHTTQARFVNNQWLIINCRVRIVYFVSMMKLYLVIILINTLLLYYSIWCHCFIIFFGVKKSGTKYMLSIHYKLKLFVLNMSENRGLGLLKDSGLYSLSWKPISRSSVIIFKYMYV